MNTPEFRQRVSQAFRTIQRITPNLKNYEINYDNPTPIDVALMAFIALADDVERPAPVIDEETTQFDPQTMEPTSDPEYELEDTITNPTGIRFGELFDWMKHLKDTGLVDDNTPITISDTNAERAMDMADLITGFGIGFYIVEQTGE